MLPGSCFSKLFCGNWSALQWGQMALGSSSSVFMAINSITLGCCTTAAGPQSFVVDTDLGWSEDEISHLHLRPYTLTKSVDWLETTGPQFCSLTGSQYLGDCHKPAHSQPLLSDLQQPPPLEPLSNHQQCDQQRQNAIGSGSCFPVL